MASPSINLGEAVGRATTPLVPTQTRSGPPTNSAPLDLDRRRVEDLAQKNPWWDEFHQAWDKVDLLYAGGSRIEKRAQDFLNKKAKEVAEVYQARCNRFSYQNVMGEGIDWYVSSVFGIPPEIDCRQGKMDPYSKRVIAQPNAPEVPVENREWYEQWRKDVDRKRSTDVAFFREAFTTALKFESAWILIDLPRVDPASVQSLRDQQMLGVLDIQGKPAPYLVIYDPRQAINWSEDENGNLVWVCFHTTGKIQQWLGKPIDVNRWYYFDRQNFEIWEQAAQKNQAGEAVAAKVASGQHLMAPFNQVPVYRMRVPNGLWLADRVFTQVKDHLNTDNEYGYALKQANLSMPVISGDMKEIPTLAEAGYLKLPPNCTLTWTEPPGNTFERSERRISSLREEIMREMYIHYQARDMAATPAAQSGYSKAIDMTPAADIQTRFGQMIKDAWAWTLNSLALIRSDSIVWELRGMHFADDPVASEIANAQQFKMLAVPSTIAEKENYKAAARVRFSEQPRTIIDKICAEIDAAPSDEEKKLQDEQRQLEQDAQRNANAFALKQENEAAAPEKPAEKPAEKDSGGE